MSTPTTPQPTPGLQHTHTHTPHATTGASSASTPSAPTHPQADAVYPPITATATPTPSRRRSARFSIPTASSSSPVPVVPFPSEELSVEMLTPSKTPRSTRKRARMSSEAVEVIGTPSKPNRRANSPMKGVETGTPRTRGRAAGKQVQTQSEETGEKTEEKTTKRRKTSPAKVASNAEEGVGRRGRMRATAVPAVPEASTSVVPTPSMATHSPTRIPGPTRPNHRKRKSEHVVPSVEELSTPKKQRKSVEFGVDEKGKGKEKEGGPKRSTRSRAAATVASTSASAQPEAEKQDVEMKETPASVEKAPKLPTRRSTRKVATLGSTQPSSSSQPTQPSSLPPHLPPSPITRPQTPAPPSPHTLLHTPPHSPHAPHSSTQARAQTPPHTPLGAAAAILASTSNAATLPARALASPASVEAARAAPVRRFTRSSLALGKAGEDVLGGGAGAGGKTPPTLHIPTSPLSPTSTLSPLSLSPPTSPLSVAEELDAGVGREGEAVRQTRGKVLKRLVEGAVERASARAGSSTSSTGRGKGKKSDGESVTPARRIGTRSSGVVVVPEEVHGQGEHREVGVGKGKARGKRVGSPLAVVGSVVPEVVEQEKVVEKGAEEEKEKGKEVETEAVESGTSPDAKGKGKAGRKRGVVAKPSPSRRSSRLSGVAPPAAPVVEQVSSPQAGPSTQSLPPTPAAASPSTAPVPTSTPLQHQAQAQPSQPPQPQPQIHSPSQSPSQPHLSSPPSSPPSPPPLRLSLASLSPPLQASGHKPHTRSPLSASSSHGLLGAKDRERERTDRERDREGSVSPLKESASLGSSPASTPGMGLGPLGLGSLGLGALGNSPPSNAVGSGNSGNGNGANGKQTMQSHTPPGSPPMRNTASWQMEIDAVDFGTPLPGPMFGPGAGGQQQQQHGQGSSMGMGATGKQPVERPTSPTSPTERRVPLVPSTLLGVLPLSDGVVVEKEREERVVEEVPVQQELGESMNITTPSSDVQAIPVDASMDENAPPMPHQPLYPALIQVEIPPAPQSIPSTQLEQGGQFGGESGTGSYAEGSEQPEQQQEVQYQQQQQQQYAPPPPQQYWEEPPRLDNERNLWRLACKVRVWDLRRRYSLETIRSLVTHEAHEYYAKNGFPEGYFSRPSSPYSSAGPSSPSGLNAAGMRTHASHLRAQALRRQVSGGSSGSSDGGEPTSPVNFMDEEVYDWEIATSDDEEGFLVDEEDEDEEDYEEYEFEEDERGEDQGAEGGQVIEEVAAVTPEGVEGEKEKETEKMDVEAGTEKEREEGGDVDAPGEVDEEERLKRRRRRSSLLRHLRKPSGEFEFPRSPSPAVQDEAVAEKKDGEDEDDVDMDIDIDLDIEDLDEALEDPNFNLELSASTTASPTSPQQVSPASPPSAGSPTSGSSNGVFTSFYVPPVPQVFSAQGLPVADSSSSALSAALGTPVEAASSSPSPASLLMDGALTSSPSPPAEALPPVQIPLQTITIPMHIPAPTPPPIIDMPPPRLSSVPVWALRNMEMSGGNMGKGTPVNRDRAAEWGNVWSMDVSKSRSVSIALGDSVLGKKDQDEFRMNVDSRGSAESGKPVLRLSLPGEGDASSSGPAGTSASMGPTGTKQAMLMDGAFEPSNQADWDAFLASLAAPMNTTGPSSSSTSSLMGAQSMQHQGMQDHHQAPPPPYSSLNPNPLQQSPPPTPTPPSPASSTSSLHENAASLGGGSMTIHSPGTSQGNNNGMMNPGMFGMMNVNMMFGVPGGQGGGNGYPQQSQPQHQQQLPMQSQQGVGDGSQPCYPSMGLTMSMPPPGSMNSMGQQPGSYNNGGMQQQSFNSMPSFNMGMGMGMNPPTMNMNVPLNMGMGMPMGMPMMQMPMSMPFAGLQLGVTLSLAPQQHSGHHQQQQQAHQQQNQWIGGAGMNGGQGMEYDMGGGMGMGGVGEGMFSLVNTSGTPANTPLNSPLSPSSASIPSSMLGVLGGAGSVSPGPMSPDSEKGPGQASSALSYALG